MGPLSFNRAVEVEAIEKMRGEGGAGMALEKELNTYRSKLQELKANEGKFVLIHGDEVVEIYDTYEDAIKQGYSRFGLDPFLVKQIHAIEQAQFISRMVTPVPAGGTR